MSTKRKQSATNGESVVARSKKRNPKLFSLWRNVDNNRKEVDENKQFVRPGGDKGGRVLGLKVVNAAALGSGSWGKTTPVGGDPAFFDGGVSSAPRTLIINKFGTFDDSDSVTSVSGENLLISFVTTSVLKEHSYIQKYPNYTPVGNGNPLPANSDLSKFFKIFIIQGGHHWKVGDSFEITTGNWKKFHDSGGTWGAGPSGPWGSINLKFVVSKVNKPKK